jgi:voltage-gated potassium channel
MTNGQEPTSGARRVTTRPWTVIIRSVLRAVGSVIVLVTVYYLLPLDTSATWAAITILVTGLVGLTALVAYSVWSILSSPFPGLRAIEALAVIVPLFLVLFAGAYFVMERLSPASFTQPLTHTDALYFTVTVFTTVGFGDITARTEAARVLVTVQMIMDLVIIGAAIQAVVGAARHGRERRSSGSSLLAAIGQQGFALGWCGERGDAASRCREDQTLRHDSGPPMSNGRTASMRGFETNGSGTRARNLGHKNHRNSQAKAAPRCWS